MCEFAMSKAKKAGVASLEYVVSELFKVLSFVLSHSHPLYLSYLIFFSPYLIKLFSFLSPLFVTTALLLLAFLTTLAHADPIQSLSLSPSHSQGEEEEFSRFEDLEVYKIVFDVPSGLTFGEDHENGTRVLEEVVKETCQEEEEGLVDKCLIVDESVVIIGGDSETKKAKWCLGEEKKEWEKAETKVIKPAWIEAASDDYNYKKKVSCVVAEKKEAIFPRSGSKAKEDQNEETYHSLGSPEWDYSSTKSSSSISISSSAEGSPITSRSWSTSNLGSMRKEKEWRRTLACKLFEERHNAAHHDGSEGMDLLWETYEKNEPINRRNKAGSQGSNKTSKVSKNAKKGGPQWGRKVGEEAEEEDEEEEYEDEANGQLCCLQALKFSAGKVNLGMARPNLVKISKALKGIGWLQNVTRHAKKRYTV